MIKAIELDNFQSHKNTALDFHSGVNVITGRSDSGKTSIFRALRWLAFNQPRGRGFISHWADQAHVVLYVDDDWVERSAGKSRNLYKWSVDSSDFKAFGAGVPEEIQDLLKLSDINLQPQLDAPFLLSESAGGVARHFNDVANLDVIDLATSNVNKLESRLKNRIQTLIKSSEELEEKLTLYDGLDEIEKELYEVEALDNRIKNLYSDKDKLVEIIGDLKIVQEDIRKKEPFLKLSDELEDCITVRDKVRDYLGWILDLGNLIDSIRETESQIKISKSITRLSGELQELLGESAVKRQLISAETALSRNITELHDVRVKMSISEATVALSQGLNELIDDTDVLESLQSDADDLRRDITFYKTAQANVEVSERNIKHLEEQFHEAMPDDGTCPLCGGKVNVY